MLPHVGIGEGHEPKKAYYFGLALTLNDAAIIYTLQVPEIE